MNRTKYRWLLGVTFAYATILTACGSGDDAAAALTCAQLPGTAIPASSIGLPCVFRPIVTARFGIVTAEFGNVTGDFGDVTDRVLNAA